MIFHHRLHGWKNCFHSFFIPFDSSLTARFKDKHCNILTFSLFLFFTILIWIKITKYNHRNWQKSNILLMQKINVLRSIRELKRFSERKGNFEIIKTYFQPRMVKLWYHYPKILSTVTKKLFDIFFRSICQRLPVINLLWNRIMESNHYFCLKVKKKLKNQYV